MTNLSDWSRWSVPGGSAWTGNFADYQTCAPHVCCGWMDLHEDIGYGVTPESPDFLIRPLCWDEQAVLVITDDQNKFQLVYRTSEPVRFNGTRLHGLVPLAVGQELVERQDTDGPLYAVFLTMAEDDQTRPKLVWDWLNPNPS